MPKDSKRAKRGADSGRLALAGEFAVLSRLALAGYDANMTLGHTKGVDILVSDPTTGKMARVEVKTSQCYVDRVSKNKCLGPLLGSWIMKKDHERLDDPSLFFCFVSIPKVPRPQPRFFVVPSAVVARHVRETHVYWLKWSKENGRKVKDTNMRLMTFGVPGEQYPVLVPVAENHEDAWSLISKTDR